MSTLSPLCSRAFATMINGLAAAKAAALSADQIKVVLAFIDEGGPRVGS
jgi:hypothetical protein